MQNGNTAEVIELYPPRTAASPGTPEQLSKVYIVFSIDERNEQRLAMVDGTFSRREFAEKYINSRDPQYLISFEIEEHTLDWHEYFE